MSKATKRKHVTKEVMEDYYVPEDGEEIVKVVRGCGNNLHEVEVVGGDKYLVSMPTKFRKNVWVKRGDFVIVSPIEEGNKVKGEIVYILYAKQIKYLKNEKLWPEYFDDQKQVPKTNEEQSSLNCSKNVSKPNNSLDDGNEDSAESSSDDDDDDGLFENPNHRPVYYYDEDDSESESESEDEEEAEKAEHEVELGTQKEVSGVNDQTNDINQQLKTIDIST